MIVTNIITSAAYKGKGVIVTIDPSVQNDRESISWFYPGMQVKSEASGDKGIVAWVDRKGTKFCVMPIQPDKKFEGSASNKLKASDTIYFDENKIGDLIWKLELLDQIQMGRSGVPILEVTSNVIWPTLNNTTPAFCYPLNDINKKSEGIIYNRAAVKDIDFCPPGWRLPNMYDVFYLGTTVGFITKIGNLFYPDGIGKLKSTPGSPYPWTGSNVGAQNPSYKNFNSTPKYIRASANTYNFTLNQGFTYYWMSSTITQASFFNTIKIASGQPSTFQLVSSNQLIQFLTASISAFPVRLVRDFNPSAGIS